MIQKKIMTIKKIEKNHTKTFFLIIIHEGMILFEFSTISKIEDLIVK